MLSNNISGDFVKKSDPKKLWKRSFFYFAIAVIAAIILTAAAVGIYLCWFYNIRQVPPPDISPIRNTVRSGDIILRSGVGLWSKLFCERNPNDKRFSHVGLVWITENGEYMVIHSEGNDTTGKGEVSVISLQDFVGKTQLIGISRLRTGDPAQLVANAKKFMGRPFDWKFDIEDHSEIYCTELLVLALRETIPGIVLPRHKNIVMPEALLIPEYFTEITP